MVLKPKNGFPVKLMTKMEEVAKEPLLISWYKKLKKKSMEIDSKN